MYCGPNTGCVDLSTDMQNCGMCGNDCPANATCVSGQCACPQGEVACGNTCSNLSNDPQHCGDCQRNADRRHVRAGMCVCEQGKTLCPNGPGGNPACADLQTDPRFCGDCGTQCPTGSACVAGQCECMGGQQCGMQLCVNTQSSPANCGMCGVFCQGEEFCNNGQCACRSGLTDCPGDGCVDLTNDKNNCGACGNDCGDNLCINGACVPANNCPMGMVECDGGCVPQDAFQSDPLNCGQCGDNCGANQVCASGDCRGYFAPPGCNACPCAQCGVGSTCCTYPGADFPICVFGDTCPQ